MSTDPRTNLSFLGDTWDAVREDEQSFLARHGGHFARLVHWGTTPEGLHFRIRTHVSADPGPR